MATFLPGKRIVVQMPKPSGTPPKAPAPNEAQAVPGQQMLFQFEEDGTFSAGIALNSQAFGEPGEKPTYKVADLRVTILKNGKKGGGITFQSPSPKKGDMVSLDVGPLDEKERDRKMTATISSIEKASALKSWPLGGPEGIDGGPAIGVGPAEESSNSKHPAFIAHTWKSGPFSKGVKQTATFDKTGALTITLDKGKPIKGTWEVAGPQITLTYPDPATGKEQALKYRFLFGGSELIGDDGKVTEKTEMLMLEGVGKNKTSIAFERPIGP